MHVNLSSSRAKSCTTHSTYAWGARREKYSEIWEKFDVTTIRENARWQRLTRSYYKQSTDVRTCVGTDQTSIKAQRNYYLQVSSIQILVILRSQLENW